MRRSKTKEAKTVWGRFPYSPAKSRIRDFEVDREAIDMRFVFKICIIRVLRNKIGRRTICFDLDIFIGDVTSVGVVGGVVTCIGAVVGAGGEVGWDRSPALHVADNEMTADRGGISGCSKAGLCFLSVAPTRSGESACVRRGWRFPRVVGVLVCIGLG